MEKQIGITSSNLKSQTALKKFYSGKERSYNGDLVNTKSVNFATWKTDNGSTTSNVKEDLKNL